MNEKIINEINEYEISAFGPKRLHIYFYTSNLDKFLQARYIFSENNFILEHYPSHTNPYEEDYSAGKEELLGRAINKVREIIGSNSVFFIEDTSLRIESLSSKNVDFPGLQVKEWFISTNFANLDKLLLDSGNNRQAIIKSGIALYIPGKTNPILFQGETNGMVAETPPVITRSRIYPWLTTSTFDGWFIPNGSNKRLGEMNVEESTKNNFRARALTKLIERISEYSSILNVPSSAYSIKKKASHYGQIKLFTDKNKRYIVTGYHAAGKTIFGEYSSNILGAEHHEASSIIRSFYREIKPKESEIGKFAESVHKHFGEDIVAKMLISNDEGKESKVIIYTGLRKFEELDYIRMMKIDYKLIFIQASERTRYERYVKRAREQNILSFKEFCETNQKEFEYLKYARDYSDITIINEGDMDHYISQIEFVLESSHDIRPDGIIYRSNQNRLISESQLFRCLKILSEKEIPLGNREISEISKKSGSQILPNNVNKVLRHSPTLCDRIEDNDKIKYKITTTGRSFVNVAQEWTLSKKNK